MSRPWLGLSVAGAFVLLAALAAASAGAGPTAFPGRNGTILAGRGANLYAVSPDGRRRAPIPSVRTARRWGIGQAASSPDGMRIAFARPSGGISIADTAGRRVERITTRGHDPAWSPDGTQILFTRAGWLYTVGVDGRGLRRLRRGWDAQWSPNGRQIAFQFGREGSGYDIYVADVDGSERVRLTDPDPWDCGRGARSGTHAASNPAWAPDLFEDHGHEGVIAFVAFVGCGANLGSSINESSPDRASQGSLVEGGGPGKGGPFAPVWSPDGRAIAYYDEEAGSKGLWIKPIDGRARWIGANLVPFDWRPVCGLRGGRGGDRLRGSDRADLVCGLGGDDTITGGAGRDRLFGEDGNDRFFARDGEFDVVGCGSGRDTVVADQGDLAGRDCERVDRR
jgi:RTX calcium-binding nonapeptide repeat (4 copies)/WD40-like Beta Propeller Repeat